MTISKLAKRVLPSLLKKYDDLSSIDNVHAAQAKANEVQSIMGNNIRGMMDNMQNLEVKIYLWMRETKEFWIDIEEKIFRYAKSSSNVF